MASRRRALERVCAIALLELSVFPVTAPFYACDLTDLVNGHGFEGGAGRLTLRHPLRI
jgi:hypothetical protein